MKVIISQKAKFRQAAVKYALSKGKERAAQMYGTLLSSIKRWCKQWDGTYNEALKTGISAVIADLDTSRNE